MASDVTIVLRPVPEPKTRTVIDCAGFRWTLRPGERIPYVLVEEKH